MCMFLSQAGLGAGVVGVGSLQNLCGLCCFQKWQDHLGEGEGNGVIESGDKVRMSRSCLESPGAGREEL